MLGIGLGGAAKGLESGIGIGQKLQKMNREAEAERGIKEAVDGGKADHEAAVASGTAKAGDADSILRFTMPRLVVPLMKSGDFQGAQAASEWLRADTTRAATKSWGEGMLLAQSGDMMGAVKKFIDAANTKGYGPDVKIEKPETLDGGGVRVNFSTPDGRKFSQEFKTPDDLVRFGGYSINPEAAFKSWQDQQTEMRKRAAAIEDYRTQQGINIETEQKKQQLGLGPANFETQNVVRPGKDGQPVVTPYVFNRRTGTASPMKDAEGNEIGGEVSRPGTRGASAGARRPFQFEVVRDAYKQLGYSDEDATNIAAGRKPPRDVELVNLSRHLTNMEMPPSDMRYKPEQRRARQEEILKGLRDQYPSGAGARPAAKPSAKPGEISMAGNGTKATPYKPANRTDYDEIPSGAYYVHPQDGQVRIKK